MKCQYKLLVAILMVPTLQVMGVPLHQFFHPFGKMIINSPSTNSTNLMTSIFILNREWNYLHVNAMGALNLSSSDSLHLQIRPRFQQENDSLQFSAAVYRNIFASSSYASQLIQENLNYTFNPTQVLAITWVNTTVLTSNTTTSLQCVLATRGNESFIFYLYEDDMLINNGVHIELQGENGAALTYTAPNNSTLNSYSTSNVNQSGLWILKVNDAVIGGLPGSPRSTEVISTTTTEVVLQLEYSNTDEVAECFTAHCLDVSITINIIIDFDLPSTSSQGVTTNYTITVSSLDEYTNYTCTVVAKNIFGIGPASEDIYIQTEPAAPSGPPLAIRVIFVSLDSIQLDWIPPSEKDRNGVITGYRILLDRDMGQAFLRGYSISTQYSFTGLQEGTTYYYRIAAETIVGTGPYSNRTSVTTKLKPQDDTSEFLSLEVLLGLAGGGATLIIAVVTSLAICCAFLHKQRKKIGSIEKTKNIKDKESRNKTQSSTTKKTEPCDKSKSVRTTSALSLPLDPNDVEETEGRNQYTEQPKPKSQSSSTRDKKVPMLPPNIGPKTKPKPKLRKQQESSESMYMALRTSNQENQQQLSQYMVLHDSTRRQPGSKSSHLKTGHISSSRLRGN